MDWEKMSLYELRTTTNQNKVEDRKFVQIMKHLLTKSESGNWEVPLLHHDGIEKLPNNQEEALKSLKSTRHSLDKKPLMKQHYFDFMQKLFDNGHAEPALKIQSDPPTLQWYLPHFGVYHPQSHKKYVVFDSAP